MGQGGTRVRAMHCTWVRSWWRGGCVGGGVCATRKRNAIHFRTARAAGAGASSPRVHAGTARPPRRTRCRSRLTRQSPPGYNFSRPALRPLPRRRRPAESRRSARTRDLEGDGAPLPANSSAAAPALSRSGGVRHHYLAVISGQRRGLGAMLQRVVLSAAALPYGLAVRVRNFLYNRGWLRARNAAVP